MLRIFSPIASLLSSTIVNSINRTNLKNVIEFSCFICFSQMWSAPLHRLQVDGGELARGAQGARRAAGAEGGGPRRQLARVQHLLVQDAAQQVSAAQLLDQQQGEEAAPPPPQVEGPRTTHQGCAHKRTT